MKLAKPLFRAAHVLGGARVVFRVACACRAHAYAVSDLARARGRCCCYDFSSSTFLVYPIPGWSLRWYPESHCV